MSDEKLKKLIGSLGVIYNNDHMTAYLNQDKAINCSGAETLVMIIGFNKENAMIAEVRNIKEFPLNKIKVK